jgi:type II secretory pathway component PulF
MENETQEFEVLAHLKDGRKVTVTVEAEDREEAKYLLHHCGRTVNVGESSCEVDRYDYRTVKKAAA